jgi:hypothetical protein
MKYSREYVPFVLYFLREELEGDAFTKANHGERKTAALTLSGPIVSPRPPAATGSESDALHGSRSATSRGRHRAGRDRSARKQKPVGSKPANRNRGCPATEPHSTRLEPKAPQPQQQEETARRGACFPCSPSFAASLLLLSLARLPPPSPNPIGEAKFSEKSRGAPDPSAPYIARHMQSANPVAAGLSPLRAHTHLPPL